MSNINIKDKPSRKSRLNVDEFMKSVFEKTIEDAVITVRQKRR